MTQHHGTTRYEADWVVVGAGTAGCALAARLGAHGSVLLLEAGGPDGRPELSVPAGFPALFGGPYDWGFRTVAQPGFGGRGLAWPRGKVLGGSSALNAQIWTRGHRADFDGWGMPGWSFEEVLPYFRRAEDRAGGPGEAGYGVGGPVRIEDLRDPSPATADFLAACAAAGHAPLGAAEQSAPEGYGPVRVTQRDGRRWSAADAYLHPAPGTVRVLTGAHARRVVLERGRAVAVEADTPDGPRTCRAGREVVLCAGAVGSPHLLQLSGIGDPADLRAAGVPVRVGLPGVGRRLADHLFVPLARPASAPLSPGVGDQRPHAVQWIRSRRGRLTSTLAEALLFLRTEPGLPAPDVELVWMVIPQLGGELAAVGHGVTVGTTVLQPASLGRVRLVSPDPAVPPAIDPGYLGDPAGADLRTAMAGVRTARELLAAPELAGWLDPGARPGPLDATDDTGLAAAVRSAAQTLYHPAGSCSMGTGEDAVLDPELRVRGVERLRVVDAAALPTITRAHTQAPAVMLAERAAELMTAARPVPPLRAAPDDPR